MEDEIASIAQRELGATPVRVARIAEGLLHETYELECDGGEFVLQFSSDADDGREDSLSRELNWYVALQGSEIPVPGIVTETVREFGERRYTLVEKLPGKTAERNISPEKTRNAGGHLGRIHASERFETTGWIRFADGTPSVRGFREGGLKRWIRQNVEESSRMLRNGGLEAVGREVE